MRRLLVLLAIFAGVFAGSPARADTMIADLSSHLIAINSSFDGDDVLMFGAVEGRGDVIVVVRGPEENLTIRRKERVGGIWVNNAYQTFNDVPVFYAISATRPIEELLPDALDRKRHAIGFDQIAFKTGAENRNVASDDVGTYIEALVRNKQRIGLYRYAVGDISIASGRLFRAPLHFPANVPEGIYRVEVYHVRNGDILSAEITPLSISKVGLEFEVYDFATRNGLAYGILAVIIACFAGWLGNIAFRKS
ncbi:MAG: TIGR02186 family protein [Rhodospirillales bacterium]